MVSCVLDELFWWCEKRKLIESEARPMLQEDNIPSLKAVLVSRIVSI